MLRVEYVQKPMLFLNCGGLMDCFSKIFLGGTAVYRELEKIITYCWVFSAFTIFNFIFSFKVEA